MANSLNAGAARARPGSALREDESNTFARSTRERLAGASDNV
jgi:hypothetical protein